MEALKQLGKYKIVEVIGQSGFATAYKAIDPEPERTVALKVVLKEGLDEKLAGGIVARFKNQLLAAERLAHPGIADVYDHGEDEHIAYLATEYLAGRGLRDFLTLHLRLGLKDIRSIMGQLLAALDFAHANGVVHRDVKPTNIIMLLSGRLKLADFGIALIDTFDFAQAGVAAGTPAYMSPEQHSGQEADRRSDIFSCGVVLYELLTGSKPFEGSPDTVGLKICHEPYRVASKLNQGSPATFDAVLARALAKKPDDRFPTVREFATALDSAFKDAGDASNETDARDSASEVTQPSSPPVSSPRLNAEALRSLEVLLTLHVGPMAKLLIKQSAKTASDGPTLVSALAKYIPAEANRRAFITSAMEKVWASASLEAADEEPTVHFSRNLVDVDQLEIAVSRLAPYLGPIAKVLAKKTPGRTSDLRAYYRQLAENIADPADRARFLKDAGYAK